MKNKILPICLSLLVSIGIWLYVTNVVSHDNGQEIKTVSVANIQAVNVPEGMNVVLLTKRVNVTIRGTQEALDGVDASKIFVIVDFTNMREGTYTMPAQILIDAGFGSNVSAIGQYTVNADIQRS